jgi:release factor glutamine methyltransferase
VFVPRRRSELLARLAIDLASESAVEHPVVVDLCCGSGAVGAAVSAAVERVDVHAADIDHAAVQCARRNLPPERVYEGDLYTALPEWMRGRVDVLVANAPYVPTDAIALMPAEARLHEALVALDGGADGLDVQHRIAAGALSWLSPDGHLLIETSADQAETTAEIFASSGLRPTVTASTELEATVVVGVRST